MKLSLPNLRSPRRIWATSSGLARVVIYLAGLEAIFYLAQFFFRLIRYPHGAETLSGWITTVGFVFVVLSFVLFLRWFRRKVMWSLRNRLIVTYIFIGVIPVLLLLAIVAIAGFLFTSQFATFVATSDIQERLNSLRTANEAIARQLAAQSGRSAVAKPAPADLASDHFPELTITVWRSGKPEILAAPGASELKPISLPGGGADVTAITRENAELFLRSATSVGDGKNKITVISSVPFDRNTLQSIAEGLGELTVSGRAAVEIGGHTKVANNSEDSAIDSLVVRAGTLPPPVARFDREVSSGTPVFSLLDWGTGNTEHCGLAIDTRLSVLSRRLFASFGSYANAFLILLAAIAIAFGILELLALFVGVRLTRTMTGSVYELYQATQRINRGDLSHRIQVRNHDQMAELESSFNSMSESLERLLQEQKEKQRIESELAIAQEVQSQLFPHPISNLATLEVHGFCRPARSVSGDYYDFLPLGSEKMVLAVGDISGKGISAALLMATIHSAVRVYEVGRSVGVEKTEKLVAAGATSSAVRTLAAPPQSPGVLESPATVLSLLNRHLYASTPLEKYATMFLGFWDGKSRKLTYSNGGHLPPLIIRQNGSLERLAAGGTVVGLFNEVQYEETSVEVQPGDLFLAYSDGVTEPENEFGEFGEMRLVELVSELRKLPLTRISDGVVTAVLDWIGAAEQPDDVTVVLARAK